MGADLRLLKDRLIRTRALARRRVFLRSPEWSGG
jgi:hypothetical protein